MERRRSIRHAIGAVLLALVAGLGARHARTSPRAVDAQARGSAAGAVREVDGAVPETMPEAPPAIPVDVPTEAQLDAGVVPQAGPGEIVVRRKLWDTDRARLGLPSVDPALVALDDLPRETEAQAADPDAHQLYLLERELRTSQLLAEHEALEGTRFGLEALEHPPGKKRREIEMVASQHAELSRTYQERALALEAERRQFIAALVQSQNAKE